MVEDTMMDRLKEIGCIYHERTMPTPGKILRNGQFDEKTIVYARRLATGELVEIGDKEVLMDQDEGSFIASDAYTQLIV